MHFPKLHDEVLSPESNKYSKRHKTSFSPLHRENNPSLIMTITKSRDDSCSSFLRAKLIRKEKRSAISSQCMNPSRIYLHNCILQQSDESIKDFSITPLLQNSIQKRCCHFLQRKTKIKTSTFISQRFHQNTGPSLLNISRK